jgi:hypothetical protein
MFKITLQKFVNPLTYGKFLALSDLAEVKENHTRVESLQKLFTEKSTSLGLK